MYQQKYSMNRHRLSYRNKRLPLSYPRLSRKKKFVERRRLLKQLNEQLMHEQLMNEAINTNTILIPNNTNENSINFPTLIPLTVAMNSNISTQVVQVTEEATTSKNCNLPSEISSRRSENSHSYHNVNVSKPLAVDPQVQTNVGRTVARNDKSNCLADQPIFVSVSMPVLCDDATVNTTIHSKQLVGDECRICLKSCRDRYQLFDDDDRIPEKLMTIAAVKVEEGDGLPAYICLACNYLLDVSYNFRCQIQSSDVKLRQILKSQIQPMPHAKDTIIIKDVADIISNVESCKKDNHIIENNIYSSHNITLDNTAIRSDPIINNESHISQKFKQKVKIIKPSEKRTPCGIVKKIVNNAEMVKGALSHEAHVDNVVADPLSNLITENGYIKQEELILPEDSETLENLMDQNSLREDKTSKIRVKKNIFLENFNDHVVSKQIARCNKDILKMDRAWHLPGNGLLVASTYKKKGNANASLFSNR